MKKAICLATLALMMTIGVDGSSAQMMGGGQHMSGEQESTSSQKMMGENAKQPQSTKQTQQNYPYMMNPNMMGYGYTMPQNMMMGTGGGAGMMNPGMMGNYSYGMPQGMMGYGMAPNMMNPNMMSYGYAMPQNMMGYGMVPNMMSYGTHGMGHHGMMQGCGTYPGTMGTPMMGYDYKENYEKHMEKQKKFFEETQDMRKELHMMKFDFNEASRDPEGNSEKLKKMENEMNELHKKMREKADW